MNITQVSFTIPGPPRGKQRARTVRIKNRTMSYTPDQTAEYEAKVRSSFSSALIRRHPGVSSFRPHTGPATVQIVARMPIAQSFSAKKQHALHGTPCMKTPDVDNIGKIIADGLNGVAWYDDKCIVSMSVRKIYDMHAPGCDVVIQFHETDEQPELGIA